MEKKILKNDGECFNPDFTNAWDLQINLEHYLLPIMFCEKKVVLDAASGAGLGTFLLSLVAKKIYSIDYRQDHLDYQKQYPFKCEIEFLKKDLNKDLDCDELPEADVLVCLETLEHLKDPVNFLKKVKVKEMVFSTPIMSKSTSCWHIQDWKSIAEISKVIADGGFRIINSDIQLRNDQKPLFFMGYARKEK